MRLLVYRESARCRFCYSMRLRQAAYIAKTGNFQAFTSTLLVSPYQNHKLVQEIGQAAGAEYGIAFIYMDFRTGFQEGQQQARKANIYRQQYCGCIYSERDRFQD